MQYFSSIIVNEIKRARKREEVTNESYLLKNLRGLRILIYWMNF